MTSYEMASFRRTMSTMQRDNSASNGDPYPGSPPSHKLSHTQNYSPSALVGLSEFGTAFHKIWAHIICICSRRSSRSIERSKPRGQLWKRAFFHFLVCFLFGIFIGLTPFVSVDQQLSFSPLHRTSSFEIDPPSLNVQEHLAVTKTVELRANASIDMKMEGAPGNESSDDALFMSPLVQDSNLEYQNLLIIVTATHNRPFQAYYLQRLAHTLRLARPPLLWIVVEVSAQSAETAEILRKTGVLYRHLVCDTNLTSIRQREVHQRNVALSHIEKHQLDGIVYFAADHNVYSVDLFETMRTIRRFGTWPVALLTESKNRVILEGPVCNNSQVIGWHTNQRISKVRRFHVDISGFAFNSTILWDLKRWHRPTPEPIRLLEKVREGVQGSTFIEQIVEDESQMEGLPENCSRIMVWHFQLEAPQLLYPRGWLSQKNLEVVVSLT